MECTYDVDECRGLKRKTCLHWISITQLCRSGVLFKLGVALLRSLPRASKKHSFNHIALHGATGQMQTWEMRKSSCKRHATRETERFVTCHVHTSHRNTIQLETALQCGTVSKEKLSTTPCTLSNDNGEGVETQLNWCFSCEILTFFPCPCWFVLSPPPETCQGFSTGIKLIHVIYGMQCIHYF